MIEKYYIPEADIDKYILGRLFKYKGKNYKIYQIEKTWGEVPCLLAYVMAINDDGTRQRFVVHCMVNIYTKNNDDKWVVEISEDD